MAVEKPDIIVFGQSLGDVKRNLATKCTIEAEFDVDPIELPTAQSKQTQIDCTGFEYAGGKRKIELIFADEVLDMVWILTEADENSMFVNKFTELYGSPTHSMDDAVFFLEDGVAVRNQPHEVLFISERLKPMYQASLEGN